MAQVGAEPLHVGVAGLGTVGSAVLKLLEQNGALIAERAGRELRVIAVSARNRQRDRGVALESLRWYDDPLALAADPEVELVVELIGGADGPALALCRAALAAGKPVVTANKALLAHHGAELARLADAHRVTIGFEAAVAGGIPIVKTLREGLAGNRIRRVYGILNGTCNYILTTMRETGRGFDEVLQEAQQLGYAEADPSFDIDGVDTAHKLALLSALAFGCPPDFEAVYTEGIRHIAPLDIAFASEMGYRIKLLGVDPPDRAWPRAAGPSEHGPDRRADQPGRGRVQRRGRGGRPGRDHALRRARRRRWPDRLGGGGRPRGHRQGRPPAGVRAAEPAAEALVAGADGSPLRRLLFSPHGGGQARRDGRRCGLPARS